MHTGQQLKPSLFTIRLDGVDASMADLFPGWDPLDRFGIVVHEPFGGIGASHLLQAAIAAYYDARPGRRELEAQVYPEVYVFHAGGRFGSYINFDVFPSRKEVFVDNDPAALLGAINDRAITRLAVPDRSPDLVQHEFKEPAQALERISSAWAYSATGRVPDADVSITTSSPLAQANTKMTLDAKSSAYERQLATKATDGAAVRPNERLEPFPDREDEVPEADRIRVRDARADLDDEAGRTETYRRIEVTDALRMLHHGTAPPFAESVALDEVRK